ncbi:glycerophosphodiester phosphodiesterase [Streptomyces sp. NBC_01718]|uniref:glycerophosphodiester phosphodiesterase n=1 Tax=Streptomyces sp. NBC_01718 TaxID=2975919 RepID=UPI00352DBF52
MRSPQRPLVYGHRGSRAEAPENTLHSFRRAHEVGAEGVELDVRVSRDGHLLVIHDSTVDRTTNGTGEVAKLTFKQLRTLNAGEGERIPTLTEVLDVFPGLLQIEIKAPEAVPALCALDEMSSLPDRAMLTSFDQSVLAHAAEAMPHVQRGLITHHCGDELVEAVARLKLSWVCLELRPNLTSNLVERLHDVGVKVDLWPATDAERLARCVDLGADAITTDHPGLIDSWLTSNALTSEMDPVVERLL